MGDALHSKWSGNKNVWYAGAQDIVEFDGDNLCLNLPAGSKLKIGGVDVTNSVAAGSVAGVAPGYKLARGTLTPDAASKTVVTGLGTVIAAVAQMKGAPTIDHSMVAADVGNQAGAPAAGSILIKSYCPTSNADPTPTAATQNYVAVDWIAIGTA